jgi:tetratricopeptide (TPR) repeat protein
MNREEKIKELLRRRYGQSRDGSGRTQMDERILTDASTNMKQALAANQSGQRVTVWRTIMRTRTVKLAGPIAAAVVAVFVIAVWEGSASTAWSLGQTIAAIKQLKTVNIKGTTPSGSDRVDFECWMRFPEEDSKPFKMRYEQADGEIYVIQGNIAYRYFPEDDYVEIRRGPQMKKLKLWYRASEFSPWYAGKMLEILKLFTDDWQQVVQTDPDTGKQQVHVTCSYRPSKMSIWFVVDMESKLIEQGKTWSNLQREGEPEFDAHAFLYNEEVPDEIFEFDVPAGAKVATQESLDLINRAGWLSSNKKYAEELEVLQQLREECPDTCYAHQAPIRMAGSYYELGQYDKAIQTGEKAVREYPYRDIWLQSAYLDLGRCYMEQGQSEKALEAFQKSLTADEEGRGNTEKLREKARDYIAQIKGE